MLPKTDPSKEIFSFHLAKLALPKLPCFLYRPLDKAEIPGLKHSETFFTMNLGSSIVNPSRYNLGSVALFAWWSSESSLNDFLQRSSSQYLTQAWHVRLKPYRRWGEVSEIREATIDPALAKPDKCVVAITLARLKFLEAPRFIKWGKPVEKQVRDHPGTTLALAAMRPFNTFCTFSIWKSEQEMLGMVNGRSPGDGSSHQRAMQERDRRNFHYEFTTLRLSPIKEVGSWNEKSGFTL